MADAVSTRAEAHDGSMPAGVAEDDMVLFAVPKKGRIHQEIMDLLNGSGLEFKRPERLDVAVCKQLPVKIVFLPAADIPSYVMDGGVDLGISGEDMLEETLINTGYEAEKHVKILMKLGIGKCKLCLQAPKTLKATDPSIFIGKRIVTSFPAIARRFFDNLERNNSRNADAKKTTIKEVSGSVEAACGLGLADAVIDLVETGSTMHAAGLEVVGEPVLTSETLLFQQLPTEDNGLAQGRKAETINTITERIMGYLTSTRFAMVVYNCHEDNLERCCAITPGKRSPTITALKEKGWQSVSALVEKRSLHSVMDNLTKEGAKDVLCLSLTNTRM